MNSRAEEFVRTLEKLHPSTNDNLVADLYDLLAPLEKDPTVVELFEGMFHVLETHPGADFGVPGPLVRLIESHSGSYESRLRDSVSRAPMYSTIHMVNRILNTDLQPVERQGWLDILKMVAANQMFRESHRKQAENFLELQAARDAD